MAVQGQDIQWQTRVIPWAMCSYDVDATTLPPTSLQPAALPELSGKSISFQAENHFGITGAGLFELVVQGGGKKKGWAVSGACETSAVHQAWKAGIAYGLRINPSLSIGSSWQVSSYRMQNLQSWQPGICLDFQYRLNDKIRWGGRYKQTGRQKSIGTGFAYHLTDNLQLTAEVEKKNSEALNCKFMLSCQPNREWHFLLGADALSSTPFFGISRTGIKQAWRGGLSIHPELGTSFQLTITFRLP